MNFIVLNFTTMKNLFLFIFMICPFFLTAQSKKEKGSKWVNGTQLEYQMYGKGEPLIVLHGGPGMDASYLSPGIDKLGKLYSVVVYNQRGSDNLLAKPDTLKLNADQFVEDLEGLRKALGLDKINVMGHSWGGLLAMKYAVRYPQHLKTMILVSTASADAAAGEVTQKIFMERLSQEDRNAYLQMISEGYHTSKNGIIALSKIHWKPYVYQASHTDMIKDAYSEDMFLIQHHINKSIEGYDLHRQLSELEIPTLIIHGDYDPIPMEAIQKIHHSLDRSQLVVIRDCGHFPFIEQPDKFVEIITVFNKINK